MRRKLLAALLALALAGAACSSGTPEPEADTPDASETVGEKGDKRPGKGGQGKNKPGSKKGRKGKGKTGANDPNGPGAEVSPGTGGSGDAYNLEPRGEGGAEFATKSAHFEESQPDAKTEGPLVASYAEATAIDVQGLGENLRITFTFAEQVPQKMETDQTHMFISFALSAERKGKKGYGINAQGSSRGWQAALGMKDDAQRFPGTFFVRGNTAEFTLPWKAIGGPRPFEFYASASWFRYAGTTSYSLDPIPNLKGIYPN